MRQQSGGQRDRRVTFFRFPCPLWRQQVAALRIEPSAVFLSLEGSAANDAQSPSGVQRYQDETRDMSATDAATIRGPNQGGSLVSGQPSFTRRSSRWQHDADNTVVQTFLAMVVDSGSQIFKVTSSCRICARPLRIFAAQTAVDVGERLAAKEGDQA